MPTNEAKACIENENIDLIFLDIQMPDISGLHFYKKLSRQPMVIFTTAFRDFAVDGFDLNAIDYLVKPIEFDRFKRSIQKAIDYKTYIKDNNSDNKSEKNIFVKSDYSIVKIRLEDLYLVETMGDYVKLFLFSKSRPVITLLTMKEVIDMLPKNQFARVHRSYIVSMQSIDSLRRNKININGREIPVGVTYQEKFKNLFKKKM